MSVHYGAAMQLAVEQSKGKMPPQAKLLGAILMDNYLMGRTPAGEPFAVQAWDAPSVAIPLRGTGGLRQRLAADLATAAAGQFGASNEALSAVLNMAEGAATQTSRVAAGALRVARSKDGVIVLDLGRADGLAAWVNAGGWGLTTRPPVLFRRSGATPELPLPVRGGSLLPMSGLVNIRGADEMTLYVACRLISVIPEGTRPVELILGQPGAIKTGTTRITVGWLGGGMAQMPRDPRDWAAMAGNAHTLGHDNVSGMSADRQDLLCKAASGHDYLARLLYSNADLFGIKFQPLTVVINGIEVGMLRADLIRRAVCHYLLRPERYLGDGEVERMWKQAHPAALGWLLDLLPAVLARMERVPRPAGDSLSDFAHVLAALDSLWETHALELWRDGQREMYEDQAEADPVAIAIRRAIAGPWEGTPKDLLTVLERQALLTAPPPGQPWTPYRLSARVDRVQAALEAVGWKIERARDPHTKSRWIRIWPSSA